MSSNKLISFWLLLFVLMLSIPAHAVSKRQVVANITTDDVNKAAMAIKFTHSIMKTKGMKATLFFNVYGVSLVDKNKPSPLYPTGQSIKEMIKDFLKDGGVVLACPMCMKNVGGMKVEDLIEGVVSRKGAGLEAVTADNTLVLSY